HGHVAATWTCPLGTRRGWHRLREEGLADDAEDLLARALDDRLQAAELEAHELDTALGAHRAEAEVREEVAWENRLVDDEALVRRLRFREAIGERLERPRPLVLRLADRRQKERLQHPRCRALDDVRARDEHRVVRRRPRGQLGRAREEPRRAVLHRAE